MKELFGLSMGLIMVYLLGVFLAAMAVIVFAGVRNRVMVKMGVRPVPRRPGQTILIIVGVMLSTVIISAAFGTGDTLSFSIRHDFLESLGTIDEVVVPKRNVFASAPYFPYERFEEIRTELADSEAIDGLTAQVGEIVPTVNVRNSFGEGSMRVAGVDPAYPAAFGVLKLTSGEVVRLDELADDEVYLNDRAAKELEAVAGDEVRLYVDGGELTFLVKGVVFRGGLAGEHSTLLVPLSRAQGMFDQSGQVNGIVVSNAGDAVEGAERSKEVAKALRVLFNDREVAAQLKELLDRDSVHEALVEREQNASESVQKEIAKLRDELSQPALTDELISLLGDQEIVEMLLGAIEDGSSDDNSLKEVSTQAVTLFEELAELEVLEVKRRGLELADIAGSFVTTFFLAFSMFSIAVGVLLIFLIFVMLAAARRSEMGMARAVGAKRRHLVGMFVFEGTAYSLASAAIGVVLGLLISAFMVGVLNRLFATFEEDFQMTVHFEPRTIVVSYCLGMVITLATVAVSAYRVSRLNIVAAVRGLPTPITVSTRGWKDILLGPWPAFVRPVSHAWSGIKALFSLRPWQAVPYLFKTLWALAVIPGAIARSVLQALARTFMQGWMPFGLGLLVGWWGATGLERDSVFSGGVSLAILGVALMVRTGLRLRGVRIEVRDRISFTLAGVGILVFWALPVSLVKRLVGELEGDFDMMFVSGVSMVGAAVWTVMYNSDLLVKALAAVTGRVGKLRPVLVTAVAYPMSSKLRTGLTLAMFALVIFTLIVMSVLTETFSTQFEEPEVVTGGWDIRAQVNFNTPIENMRESIEEEPDLRIGDFEAIGGYTGASIQVRQVGAETQRWQDAWVWASNRDFLEAGEYRFKSIAKGYGPEARDVWQAVVEDPGLAIAGGDAVPNREGDEGDDERRPWIEDLYYENDGAWDAVEIDAREPQTGAEVQLKVIAVLDRVHDRVPDLVASKALLDGAVPFPVPVTNYQFKLADGVNHKQTAKTLESAFLEHGMDAESWKEVLDRETSGGRAFFRLFTGFMALGLMVGVAALGVVSTRAVVERRQQIGVLRAIGYRRRMIQLSFLMESSFTSLLGIVIGTALGMLLAYQAVTDIRQEEGIDTIRFTIPWLQIGLILGLTYIFSLLATFLPAREASRVYPAEALRYE